MLCGAMMSLLALAEIRHQMKSTYIVLSTSQTTHVRLVLYGLLCSCCTNCVSCDVDPLLQRERQKDREKQKKRKENDLPSVMQMNM